MLAILARRLAGAAAVFAILGTVALCGSLEVVDVDPSVPVHTDSPAEILAHQHDCWTGDAPADMVGKFPGHVVMTLPNGRTVYSSNVGRALDHIFKTPEAGLTVHAFCR